MSDRVASAWVERHTGAGEDALPIAEVENNWILAAVFDGMGGSGSKRYTRRSDGRSATGAAFASEAAASAVRIAFTSFVRSGARAEAFEAAATQAIKAAIEALPRALESTSRVSGSLMLDFPTTACLVLLNQGEAKGVTLWVGDSLAFAWSGATGLKLLTWAGGDAQQAFARMVRPDGQWADTPNPSAISADSRRPWGFTAAPLDLTGIDLVFAASDGAFGAFGGPMGLEQALIAAIEGTANLDAAAAALANAMDAVKQDDVSFALLCPGADWTRVKAAAAARRARVADVKLDASFLCSTGGRAPVPERPPPPRPSPQAAPPVSKDEDSMTKTLATLASLVAVVAIAVAAWLGIQTSQLSAENERLRCEVTDARVRAKIEPRSALSAECREMLRAPDGSQ